MCYAGKETSTIDEEGLVEDIAEGSSRACSGDAIECADTDMANLIGTCCACKKVALSV